MPKEDFIRSFTDWTAQGEAPTTYWESGALMTLAMIINRRVWFDAGIEPLYPNLFITLVGPPAVHKNSIPVFIRKVVDNVPNIPMAPDEITRQKLYIRMEESVQSLEYKGQNIAFTPYNVLATEWDVFIGLKDIEFTKRLVKFYDGEDYTYETKHQDDNFLPKVYMNILGCIQPDMMVEVLPISAVGGGLTSRIIFVNEYTPRHKCLLPFFDKDKEAEIIEIANKIATVKGEFRFSYTTTKRFIEWYNKGESDHSILSNDRNFAHYLSRKQQHITKIAMLMSLSRTHGSNFILERVDFERARRWLLKIEQTMGDTFRSFGLSANARVTHSIISFIKKQKHTTASEILKLNYQDISWTELEHILTTLVMCGTIERKREGNTIKVKYIGGKGKK